MSDERCWVCLSIYSDGHNRNVLAVYLWTVNGNVIPLCERCCASWRANAAEDPGLLPEKVTTYMESL